MDELATIGTPDRVGARHRLGEAALPSQRGAAAAPQMSPEGVGEIGVTYRAEMRRVQWQLGIAVLSVASRADGDSVVTT
jgi:hypothetical protein